MTFTGSNPASLAARMPSITCSKPGPPRQPLELGGVHRVEADVDPLEPGVAQAAGPRGQQDAVGGQADVLDPGDRRQLLDQDREVAAHQGLAAGQPDLVDPQRHRDPDEPLDLLEAQELRAGQELDLLRHAVDAADVAAVRDADPQVIVRASERVDESFGWIVIAIAMSVGQCFRSRRPVDVSLIARPGWTHSSLPSAQFSFFQIGTTSLSVSISHRQASNASLPVRAAHRDDHADLAESRSPTRWTRASSMIGQRRRASDSSSAIFFRAISG